MLYQAGPGFYSYDETIYSEGEANNQTRGFTPDPPLLWWDKFMFNTPSNTYVSSLSGGFYGATQGEVVLDVGIMTNLRVGFQSNDVVSQPSFSEMIGDDYFSSTFWNVTMGPNWQIVALGQQAGTGIAGYAGVQVIAARFLYRTEAQKRYGNAEVNEERVCADGVGELCRTGPNTCCNLRHACKRHTQGSCGGNGTVQELFRCIKNQ
jgi:hypothetical protein